MQNDPTCDRASDALDSADSSGPLLVPDAPHITLRLADEPEPVSAPAGAPAEAAAPGDAYLAALDAFYDAGKGLLAKHALVGHVAAEVDDLEKRLAARKAELVQVDAELAQAAQAKLEAADTLDRAHAAAGLPQAPPA